MSKPREVIADSTYLVTRRCTQRQFLLRPDDDTNNAFIYCLAVAADRTSVQVVFTCAMSNHHHTIVHDPDGRLPEFLEHFHKLVAKCQNVWRRRWENFWDSGKPSAVRLLDAEDVISKIVYAATNPVKDFLVEKAHQWPGVSAYRALIRDEPMKATRPRYFFDRKGSMPAAVTLNLAVPKSVGPRTEVVADVVAGVTATEAAAMAHRRQTNRGVIGRKAVLRQAWTARHARDVRIRRVCGHLAARDKWRRIETLLRSRVFQDHYRRALDALAAHAPIPFPSGTYWLKRYLNVEVARGL